MAKIVPYSHPQINFKSDSVTTPEGLVDKAKELVRRNNMRTAINHSPEGAALLAAKYLATDVLLSKTAAPAKKYLNNSAAITNYTVK